jgi:deoxyribonuclease (pyrimidine dimer)
MTRVNVGVSPRKLTDRHLLAEHREIKRIPNVVASGKAVVSDLPSEFTLGAGHVRFFYDKLGYLLRRYRLIYKECKRRGFKVEDYSDAWCGVPSSLMGEYKPTDRDRKLIINRINERLNG